MLSDCIDTRIYQGWKEKHDANRRHRTEDELAARNKGKSKKASDAGDQAAVAKKKAKRPSKPFDRIEPGQRQARANDLMQEAFGERGGGLVDFITTVRLPVSISRVKLTTR